MSYHKQSMKKLLGIVVLGLLWCSASYALSQQEAIDRYLSGRKLDLIEGIWIADRGRVAVFYKSGGKYYCKAIRSSQARSGQEYCSLIKGSERIYYGRMYEQGDNVQLDVSVSLNRVNFRYYWENIPDTYGNDRIWPSDIRSHNANFDKGEEPGKSGDKFTPSSGTAFKK